jgi:hypothetical protein
MNISGKYLHKKNEFLDCKLTIKKGKIYTLDVDDNVFLNIFLSNKNQSSDFELVEKIDTKDSPYNSNNILKYYGGSEMPTLIYLKLNWLEIIRLKYAMRKWLIQSDDMKKGVLKYIIGGFLGYIGALMTQEVKEYKIAPVNPPKTEIKKSLDHKYLKTETKKDTTIIKNIKNASDL